MSVAELTYTAVAVHSATRVFVDAVMDEMAEENSDHSLILRWANGNWTQSPVASTVVSSCIVDEGGPKLVNVCATGEVKLLVAGGAAYETVDGSDEGPSPLVTLRVARTIGGKVHAAGMARRVYRRAAPGVWEPIDAGTFVPRDRRTDAVGFLTIDGFGLDDIYAAGYKGEIWHYDGRSWTKLDSPANVALNCLRCASDGFVYVAGMAGMLMRGRADAWAVIPQTLTRDDFWGGTIFKGVPYFATDRSIFRLKGVELERVDLSSLGSISTRYLDCDPEVMWSVGSKHMAATRDGRTWEAIPGPS